MFLGRPGRFARFQDGAERGSALLRMCRRDVTPAAMAMLLKGSECQFLMPQAFLSIPDTAIKLCYQLCLTSDRSLLGVSVFLFPGSLMVFLLACLYLPVSLQGITVSLQWRPLPQQITISPIGKGGMFMVSSED